MGGEAVSIQDPKWRKYFQKLRFELQMYMWFCGLDFGIDCLQIKANGMEHVHMKVEIVEKKKVTILDEGKRWYNFC